jgi:hypothetical protein
MTFFSQACRTCGTTHFIRPCTVLHATGFGLPPNFEDCIRYSKDLSSVFFLSVALKKKTCVKSDMYRVYQNCNMWYMMISESLLCVNYVILLKKRNVRLPAILNRLSNKKKHGLLFIS